MITKFLFCKKIFCVMYYQNKIWLMLQSAVKLGEICTFAANEFVKTKFNIFA